MFARFTTALALLAFSVPALAAVSGTVMTTDGQPIAGARVSIYSTETLEARRARLLSANPEAVPLFSTQTDAKGSFSLESPKESLVDLRIHARGYDLVQKRIERDEEVGAVALTKSDVKSGSVTAGGKPVAGAVVAIGYSGAEYVVKTDDAGRFEAPDPKRARTIVVIHPQYAIHEESQFSGTAGLNLNRTLTPGAPLSGRVAGADGKTPVAKAAVTLDGWPVAVSGEDGAFMIARAPSKWTSVSAQSGSLIGTRMFASGPQTIRLAKAATISGRVLDAKSKLPVAGVMIRAGGRMMRGGSDQGWSTVSDARGNYSLSIAPGTFNLVATHPAYDSRPADVNAAAGQSVSKELSLTPLARVSGTVTNDERKPVAAAVIGAQEVRDGMDFSFRSFMLAGTGNAYSGPDGRFSLRVRSDADLKLRAVKKGLPAATSEPFKLAPAERKGGFALVIPSGIAVTGIVTDRDGKPLSGVSVTAAATPPSSGRGAMVQRMIMMGGPPDEEDSVRTGTDGAFALRVVEGSHDFTFRREGFAMKAVRAKNVTVAGPNTIEASLDPAVEITGRVVRGGAGVEGVSVISFGEGSGSDALTGPDGSFTLANLTPGAARLMLRKEDELVNEQRTVTAPGRDVVIELPTGTRVSGRVVDKGTRQPLTAFQAGISTSRSGGGMVMMSPPMMRSFTSDDGSFTLENVPAGAMNFMASAPGYSAARLNLNVEENKPISDLVVELDAGVRLVGKITGPDGSPLGDATVRVAMIATSGAVMRGTDKRTTTNSSGEYELDSLEAGEETIEIVHPKYLQERKQVTLKGREVRLDAQLSSGLKVTGVVVTEAGAPVPDAEVEAFTPGGTMRRTKSDAAGRFELDSLLKGHYQFTASKNGLADGIVKDVDVNAGSPVRIVMRGGGVLYGFVRGLSAQELASATVEVRSSDGTSAASVDASGAYRIEGAPTGTARVTAVVMGRNFSGRKTSPTQTVEIANGSSVQLDLEFRTETVRGRVTRNGQAIGGAAVSFSPRPGGAGTTISASADEQGVYSATGLENGDYTVFVTDPQRFTTFTTSYEMRGSGTFDIDYAANPVRGRVTDALSNEPIEGARVQLRPEGSSSSATMRFPGSVAVTDSTGTFNLDLVPAGSYSLSADKEGFGNHVIPVNVSDRTLDSLELKLSRTDGITLKIVDARNQGPLNAMVVVFDAQNRPVFEQRGIMMTGGNAGELKIAVAPGNYTATIASIDYGAQHVSLRSPSTPTVALRPAGKISVQSKHSERRRIRLLDASGRPYPKWTPVVMPQTLNPTPAMTPIDTLAAGTYTLQLLDDNNNVVDSKPVTVIERQTVTVEI